MKKHYSQLIKDLRENYFKQNQDEFASWLGVNKHVVSKIETGVNEPNVSICLHLAAYARTLEDRDYFIQLAGMTPQKVQRLVEALVGYLSQPAAVNHAVKERAGDYIIHAPPPLTPDEEALLDKALAVLRSNGEIYGPALKSNIVAFYKAVEESGLLETEEKKKTGS